MAKLQSISIPADNMIFLPGRTKFDIGMMCRAFTKLQFIRKFIHEIGGEGLGQSRGSIRRVKRPLFKDFDFQIGVCAISP
jgi:hypothetical protein